MKWHAKVMESHVEKINDGCEWEVIADWFFGTALLRKETWVCPPYFKIRVPSGSGYDYITFTINDVKNGWAEITLDGYEHKGAKTRFYTADRYTDKYTGLVERVALAIINGDVLKNQSWR